MPAGAILFPVEAPNKIRTVFVRTGYPSGFFASSRMSHLP